MYIMSLTPGCWQKLVSGLLKQKLDQLAFPKLMQFYDLHRKHDFLADFYFINNINNDYENWKSKNRQKVDVLNS